MKYSLPSLRSGLIACALFFALPNASNAQDWEQVGKHFAQYGGGTYSAVDNMAYGQSTSISGNIAVAGAPQDHYDASGANPISWSGSAFLLVSEAGVWKPLKKLSAPARTISGMYGFSVSLSGDYLAVGEPYERLDGTAGGSVYIYRKDQGGANNWGLVKRLQSRTRRAQDGFGYSVALSGNYVVVTSRWDDLDANDLNEVGDAGAAFIFEKNQGGADNWGLVKKITASLRSPNANFGFSAAIDGDHLVIGAQAEQKDASESNALSYAGAAYLFRKDQGGAGNWGQVKKLTPTVRAAGDSFGSSVSISGSHVLVGAPYEDEDNTESNFVYNAGAAYVFGKDAGGAGNWGQVRKLTTTLRISEAQLGESVSISNEQAVAGARRYFVDAQGLNYQYESGAAFVFGKNANGNDTWGQSAALFAPVRVNSENFGQTVALDGRNLYVSTLGVYHAAGEPAVNAPGAIYVFRQDDPMPVTLAAFKAAKVENQAFLEWTTSAEDNTSHFEIQKSANAKDWTTIGTRDAAKESSVLVHYNFWDNKLNAGANYYRLKMVDQDGTFAYSSIRNLAAERGEELVAFPNPVVDKIFIKTSDFSRIASVQVRNTAGQLVFETAKVDGEGIVASDFAPGIYNIHIRHHDGSAVTRKITIIK